jgi:D-alanyl-D-alanine carboxypeptidase
MLADMTSGIASYTRDAAFTDAYFADPSKVFPPDRLVAIAVKASPAFAPGARFDYSNSNFILLGLVIEKVTQQPIADVLQARILAPLALAGTSWPGDSAKMPLPYAHGFTLQGSGKPDAPADATHWNPAWGWTAGEVISTMEDLLVYGRALGTGQGLLGKHTQVERLTSFPQAGGYGIGLGCAGGWVGHTGEIPGYNTTVFYDTRTDTTVVVQTNSDISSGACPAGETLAKDRRDLACSAPATRIFTAIAGALGRPFLRPQQ